MWTANKPNNGCEPLLKLLDTSREEYALEKGKFVLVAGDSYQKRLDRFVLDVTGIVEILHSVPLFSLFTCFFPPPPLPSSTPFFFGSVLYSEYKYFEKFFTVLQNLTECRSRSVVYKRIMFNSLVVKWLPFFCVKY